MVAAALFSLIGIGLFLLFLPKIVETAKAINTKKTEEEIEAEKEAEKLRNEKGAFGNTIDFFFGEGTFSDTFSKKSDTATILAEQQTRIDNNNPSQSTLIVQDPLGVVSVNGTIVKSQDELLRELQNAENMKKEKRTDQVKILKRGGSVFG